MLGKLTKVERRLSSNPEIRFWVHMRKERFPQQRKSKLQPKGNGPFQVLERINDNAYKIDLPGEYTVSSTLNVFDLSLFDVDEESNLRRNPSQEGENDGDVTTARTRIHLKNLEDLWQGLEQGKQRKLFSKCCPYYLNTSPSFKVNRPRL